MAVNHKLGEAFYKNQVGLVTPKYDAGVYTGRAAALSPTNDLVVGDGTKWVTWFDFATGTHSKEQAIKTFNNITLNSILVSDIEPTSGDMTAFDLEPNKLAEVGINGTASGITMTVAGDDKYYAVSEESGAYCADARYVLGDNIHPDWLTNSYTTVNMTLDTSGSTLKSTIVADGLASYVFDQTDLVTETGKIYKVSSDLVFNNIGVQVSFAIYDRINSTWAVPVGLYRYQEDGTTLTFLFRATSEAMRLYPVRTPIDVGVETGQTIEVENITVREADASEIADYTETNRINQQSIGLQTTALELDNAGIPTAYNSVANTAKVYSDSIINTGFKLNIARYSIDETVSGELADLDVNGDPLGTFSQRTERRVLTHNALNENKYYVGVDGGAMVEQTEVPPLPDPTTTINLGDTAVIGYPDTITQRNADFKVWSTVQLPGIYVATDGIDTNGGTSPSDAYLTIQKAIDEAIAGETIYVKAGDYGNENVVFPRSGTVGNPITLEGYQTTPGDTPTHLNPDGDLVMDDTLMPLLSGVNQDAGTAIDINGNQFVQIKNIQIRNCLGGILNLGGSKGAELDGIVINNCYLRDFSSSVSNYGEALFLNNFHKNAIVSNCTVINATGAGIEVHGFFNTVTNCNVFQTLNNQGETGDNRSTDMDYPIMIKGDDNLVEHCVAEIPYDTGTHGISIATNRHEGWTPGDPATDWDWAYRNEIRSCDVTVGGGGGNCYEIRHDTQDSVVDNCIARNGTRAFNIKDGPSNNTITNLTVYDCDYVVHFEEGPENGQLTEFPSMDNNSFDTITIINSARRITVVGWYTDEANPVELNASGCTVNNITGDNFDYRFFGYVEDPGSSLGFSNNAVTNATITDITDETIESGWTWNGESANLLTNGDFSDGTTNGWVGTRGATLANVNFELEITSADPNDYGGAASDGFPTEIGVDYVFTFSGTYAFGSWEAQKTDEQAANVNVVSAFPSGDVIDNTLNFTATATTTYVRFVTGGNTAGIKTIVVDNLSVVKV